MSDPWLACHARTSATPNHDEKKEIAEGEKRSLITGKSQKEIGARFAILKADKSLCFAKRLGR